MNTQTAVSAKDRFSKTLFTTTCLTVACSATAVAGTITEGTAPAPSDFPNAAKGYLLPMGTTQVFGNVGGSEGSDSADWFEFQGLSGNYSLSAVMNPLHSETGLRIDIFTDSGTLLQAGSLEFNLSQTALTGSVPIDGKLDIEIFTAEGRHFEGVGAGYSVTLNSAVPEPATLFPVGLALAGALAWRRKRSQ